jgi:mannosyltransferase
MLASKTEVNQDAVNQDARESFQSSRAPARPVWTVVSAVTLALLGAAATVLRFLFLARKPFWFDECFSAVIARLSWRDFVRLLWWREANMSLYYLLLRAWLHLDGFSPFFIRSFSVLASLATLPALFWLSWKLFDRRVGLIAVALMSCNAYHIRYAQEARSYSLFVLLATLSSGYFVASLRETSSSERNRRSYVVASVLAVYAHFYGLLLVAAQWLSLRELQGGQGGEGQERATPPAISRTTRPTLPRQTLTLQTLSRQTLPRRTSPHRTWIWIGIAVVPLLAFVAKTGAGPIRWIPQPGLHDLLGYSEHFAGNDGLPLLLLYAAACLAAVLPVRASLFTPEAGWDVWRCQFLLLWLLFPITLTLLFSLARPVLVARYFIFCLPALVILAAAGLANLRKTWMMALCLVAMLLLSLQGTLSYYERDFDVERDGSVAAANYIYDHAQPGDAILFHIAEARVPYEYVGLIRARDSGTSSATGPEIIFPRHNDHLDYRDFTGNPTLEFMRSVRGEYARVWVVLMSNRTPGHPDATTLMLGQVLAESFPRIERMQFPQVEVRLYSKP